MNNFNHEISNIIKKQLQLKNLELVEMLPIPTHSDKIVRAQTLKELIEDIEENHNPDTIEYLVQIKHQYKNKNYNLNSKKFKNKISYENIYLSNGKINVPYLIKNGDLLLNAGDYNLARNIFQVLLQSGEQMSSVLYRIGKSFESEGNLKDAQNYYEESVVYQPSLKVYQRLGAVLIFQKKDAKAGEVFERALNLKELSNEIKFELHKASGNCWTRAKKFENAENHFLKALEINPTADEIRSNLGTLYFQSKKFTEAKRHFSDAIASNPSNHLAITGLGLCSLSAGDKTTAHDYFAQSLDLYLNNPIAIFYLIKCAYEIKVYKTAAQFLECYIQISPINANLMYSLAGLEFHLGKISESKLTALKTLELQPQHLQAKELLNLIERYSSSAE